MSQNKNIVWHNTTVTRSRRETLNGHRSYLLWFTGLSGAGKSTIAHAVEERLHTQGARTFVLDGDNVRHGLCSDLGFSEADRAENLRRIGEMAKLFLEAGVISLAAFVSPLRADRDKLRAMFAPDEFIEIYCECTVDVCESRDPKGMYKKARKGEIAHFTGISAPYDAPEHAELVLRTGESSLEECVDQVMKLIAERG